LIGIKELLDLNVKEASALRLTSLNPDRGTKDIVCCYFLKVLHQNISKRLFNDAGKPHLHDNAFDWEIFFIPAGTNRLKASLKGSSLRTRRAPCAAQDRL
jgi:hypothetical protein